MNRKEKIEFLNNIKERKIDLTTLLIRNNFSLPSWYWQQFETPDELINDLRKTKGKKVKIFWHEGKPFEVNNNPPVKIPKWF